METFNLPSLTEAEIDGLKPRNLTRTESQQTRETIAEETAGVFKPAVQLIHALGSEDVKAGMVVGPWNAITNLTNATGDLIQKKPIDVSDNYLKISDETARRFNPFRLGREGVTKSDEAGLDLGEAAGAEIAGWYTGAGLLKMGSRAAWLYSLANALRRSRIANKGIKSAVAVDRAKRWADRGKFAARWSLSTSLAAPFFDYSEGNLANLTEDLINRYFDTDIDLPLSVKPGDNYLDSFGKGWATDAFAMPVGILGFSGVTRKLANATTDAFTTAKSVPVEILDDIADGTVSTYKPALERGLDGLPVGQKGGELATYDSAISRAIAEQTQIKQVTDQRDRLTKMGLIEVGENNQLELIYPGVVNKEIKAQFDAIRSQRGQLIKQANATGEDIFFQTGATTYAKLSKTNSQLIFYENGGASTDDYLRIRCVANGETTITTVDAAGSDADLIMDVDGNITLDSQTGVFISKRAGVEFSPANSAYAGMILGYTRIQNDGTSMGEAHITMDGTLTVLQTASGTNVGVTFVAPPSGNVEITFSAVVYASSKTIEFALSDNTTHNEIAETHTYDAGVVSSDETDRNKINVDWAVTGLTAGTSYTYYISGAETVSGTSYIQHGRNRTTGSHYPPIIVKATALPATITTGE